MPIAVEICVGDLESAIAAEAGGADRVELCDNLAVGGTSPSLGVIGEACRWLRIPVHVLIRPRAGGFVYSDRELAAMRCDIEAAREIGAAGVVIGVLDRSGRVDRSRNAELIEAARPMSVTFHKAIDQARDPIEAIDDLVAIGIDRVLSSGRQPSALEGAEMLARMVERADGRLAVMAGGRLAVEHLASVLQASGVREVHLGSAASRIVGEDDPGYSPHDDGPPWNRTEASLVQRIVESVRGLPSA